MRGGGGEGRLRWSNMTNRQRKLKKKENEKYKGVERKRQKNIRV